MKNCVILRSEYFKTALSTAVGDNSKTMEVKDFSYKVLSTAVDFMYGIEIDLDALIHSPEDLESLLAAGFLDVVCSDRSSLLSCQP